MLTPEYNLDVRNSDLVEILNSLIEKWETEVVEFKEANKDYDRNKIGQYFSAISNEANLKGLQYGWLVFGVRNKDRKIVGSEYRNKDGLDTLKQEILSGTTGGISFIEIFEVYPFADNEKKRIVMFQIPAAATAIPTGWHDHFYGRNGESLGALSVEELDRIRGQEKKDWSKQIISEATIDCLDEEAIALARKKYKEKMNRPHISEEVDKMTDEQFLTKIKLMIGGKLTNAAMVLLGNEDYDYLFSTPPEISWRLFDSKDCVKDYAIFKVPFITAGERAFEHIRNLTYRYMPSQLTLFPTETRQYDVWLLRELMNNCIAHSDYTIGGRIYLNEFEDRLIMTNPGTFLPGSIEPVLQPSYNPPFYRNQLLAETMVKLNMIDTQTMGIRKVFRIQQEKFFPLPDFDLSTVYLIDRVQKHVPISKDAVRQLRRLGVIEGKSPNIYVSAKVAESTDTKAQYVKNRGFEDEYYKKLIISYLEIYKSGKKQDFVELLADKLPDTMDENQKKSKIKNLLGSLKKEGQITTDSDNKRLANWILNKKVSQ